MNALVKIMLAFILLISPVAFAEDHRYCKLWSCPKRSHTLCKFPGFEISGNCGLPISVAITTSNIKNIVDAHNFFRLKKAADTHASPLPLPFKWDEELAFIAQRWAYQCENTYDECRNVDRFNVTQRIDVQESFSHEFQPSIYASIKRWFNVNSPSTRLEGGSRSTSNPFNLLTWEEINRIGCGVLGAVDFGKHRLYFVCNYGYMDEND